MALNTDTAAMKILNRPLGALFTEVEKEVGLRWQNYLEAARKFMKARQGKKAILIEVASQHPLADGERPGPEFQARLDKAAQLYKKYSDGGYKVEIYVPGSRHMDNGVEDKVSLSVAGRGYLLEQGLPADAVHGENLNDFYKGPHVVTPDQVGIFGSHDEAFVTAAYFKDHPEFGMLIAVVSPFQSRRKQLHYLANGVKAVMVWAMPPDAKTHHNLEGEISSIDKVMNQTDPTYQGPGNGLANFLRERRMRGFIKSPIK